MSPDFESVREQFPALRQKAFLDAACVSLAPRVVTDAVQRFLDLVLKCPAESATQHHIAMDEMRAKARPAAARLINVQEDEIALVESTTNALSIASQAIPLAAGDHVLISDLEFMEGALPWLQLADRGIHVDVVPHRGGEVHVGDIADRLTPSTRVAAISSVQWSNGYLCDLDALSALCRDKSLWLVVDAIQQLGAIPFDVRQTPVDLLACGGHKWLNSPFGAGFLYVRRECLPRLQPTIAGYLAVEPPAGGWGEYFRTPTITPISDYRFTTSARRLEIGGTGNYPGAIALAASLEMIEELGQQRIAEHILQLTDHLIAGLQEIGVEIVTPLDRKRRAGIVTFSVGSAAENTALMQQLLARHILVSVRYTSGVGGVRVSCHFYNNRSDVDRLLSALEAYVPRRQRASRP